MNNKLFNTDFGQTIISIILGLGLAGIFRQVCNNDNCYIIKGPNKEKLNNYYKIENDCYKYQRYSINCPI
jgi:hypothetical protein